MLGNTPLTTTSAVAIVTIRKPQKMNRWCLLVRCCGPSSATSARRKHTMPADQQGQFEQETPHLRHHAIRHVARAAGGTAKQPDRATRFLARAR